MVCASVVSGAALFGVIGGVRSQPVSALASDQRCDFSGDGLPDSVTGIPGKTVNGKKGAGAIMVRYQFAGLEFPVMYESTGLTAATGNHYGASLACGDFNGDGDTDLAIGAPGYGQDAGAVVIMYSNGTELGATAAFTQDTSRGGYNVPGVKEPGDLFGWSLAAGDFNNDGEDDLAVGAPGEYVTVNSKSYAEFGSVVVLNGSGASGLTANGKMFDPTSTNSENVLLAAETHYGYSLAVGDFDGDTIEDLAVGMPGASIRDFHSKKKFSRVGAIQELRGHHHSGLSHQIYFWEELWYPNSNIRTGDLFGFSLAAGDIDNNGRDDIAIGAPGDWASGNFPECNADVCEASAESRPGRLFIVKHGSDQFGNESYVYSSFSQGDPGVPGEAEPEDSFGFSVAIGQFDGRLGEDIAVGAPGEHGGGAVVVFYSGGFRELIWQGTIGVAGTPEEGDWFGFSLAATDQDGDGIDDLLVGSPREDYPGITNTGTSTTLFGVDDPEGIAGGTQFDQTADDGYQDWGPENTTHTWPMPQWWNPDTQHRGENYGFAVVG